MTVFTFLIASILITYLLFVLILKRGWNIAREIRLQPAEETRMFSVIVPVRNESKKIGILLEQLRAMSYPDFEVIVVDDHSTDTTASLIQEVINVDSRFKLIKNNGTGKKQAITTGVDAARGSVIATTDGDCEVQSSWLANINRHFQESKTMMVFGGVSIQGRTFFGHLQAIEFSSLIGSGLSLWALGMPVMCNGANLAFRREVFDEVNGYAGNEHVASGDDEFLMRKILARYPSGVTFLNDSDGNVQTDSAPDIRSFIQQRLRWAGKWRHNQSVSAKATALYILATQLSMITAFFCFVIFSDTSKLFALILFLRVVAEAWFLIPVCRFLKIQWRWDAFLVLQFIYPFYVVGIGLFSNLTTVKWKDRRI